VTGSVSGEVRAPVNPDEKNRADWERLKGFDQQTKDLMRQQQERENWDKLKGLDPETKKRIHGPSWPAEGTINSPFGERFHPTKHVWKKHNGIDISNPLGADVYSSESGSVSSTKPGSDGGNQVRIKHRDGTEGIYYHVTPFVREGQKVYAGDRVGKTDMTGESTGPHLHYGVYDHKYRTHVDPTTRLHKKE